MRGWTVLAAWGVVLALCWASGVAWTSGSPPPKSLFSPREVVRVIAAEVVSGRQNGSLRHTPTVVVEWKGVAHDLKGLRPSFSGFDLASAEAAMGALRPGDEISVRLVDRSVYADRTDWFGLGTGIWLTLCTTVTFLFALAFTLPHLGGRAC